MTGAAAAVVLLSISTIALLIVVVWQWRRARSGRTCRDVRDLMRQMDRLAQDIDRRMGGALADMRAAIDQADARLEALAELNASAGPGPAETPQTDAAPPHAPAAEAPDEPEPHAPHARPRASAAPYGHDEILRLSGGGLDPAQIAERLSRPVGEVDLILRLYAADTAANGPHQQAG